jgi:hypothetical protein
MMLEIPSPFKGGQENFEPMHLIVGADLGFLTLASGDRCTRRDGGRGTKPPTFAVLNH